MIRVLHLRSSCGLYGADRALLDLAQATPAPFEPLVGSIVRPGREDPLVQEAQRRGLPALPIESRGKADFSSARWLVEQVRAEEVAVLHAHDYKSLSLAALVASRTRTPIVATYHGDTAATPALRAYEALGRLLGNLTHGVAAVSAPLARRLRHWVLTAPVLHIPNGIRAAEPCTPQEREEARAALGLAPEAKVVAVVGRLSPEKGHAVLLRALRRMAAPPVVLVAGEGPLLERLKAQAQGLDVRWLGFRRDTRPVFAAADLIVLPSLTEGLPLVGLEAMALGRPLLASSVGQLPVMLSGGAGLLVPPGDEAALAEALRRALGEDAGLEQLALRALARVRAEYGLDVMAERYAHLLYAPALGGGRGVRREPALGALEGR